MGYMRHHAIIVSSFSPEYVKQAHEKAREVFNAPVDPVMDQPREVVTSIISGAINSHYTFLVGPDGSKEGWPTSDVFDERRDVYVRWLDKEHVYEDGSPKVHYAELFFADDEGGARIIRHN